MSSKALQEIASKVVRDLERTKNDGRTSVRESLEKQVGQIFIVNKSRFMRDLMYHAPELQEINPVTNKPYAEDIWKSFDKYLKTLAKQVPAKRLKQVQADMLNVQGLKADDHLYAVKTFSSAQNAKGAKVVSLVESLLTKLEKSYDKELLKDIGGRDNKTGAQIGHADEGFGFAASSVRAMRAAKIAQSGSLTPAEKATVERQFRNFERVVGISIQHAQVITARKNLKKQYTPVLSWQGTIDNQELAQLERAAIDSLTKQFKNLAELESSTTLKDGIQQTLTYELAPKGRNVKVTGKSKQVIAEKSQSGVVRHKVTRKTSVVVGRDSTSLKKKRKARRTQPGVSSSPLALIGLLNSQLPRVVAKNMREPYLNYQTGRFANSVQVTDVQMTPQGFPSIGYTYQKYPYQTYERGYRRGGLDKDPRELIDRSIREIAASVAIGRFYTRRV